MKTPIFGQISTFRGLLLYYDYNYLTAFFPEKPR